MPPGGTKYESPKNACEGGYIPTDLIVNPKAKNYAHFG